MPSHSPIPEPPQPNTAARPDDDLSALLTRLARRVRRAHIAALAPAHLHPPAARALGVIDRLSHEGEARPSYIAAALEITPRAATDLVDTLEEGGFVTRAPSATDRRATALTLTSRGHAMRRTTRRLRDEATRELMSALTDEERADLTRLLAKALDGPATR